ncbi:peptidoglycan-binding protein [Actinomadura sp. HBU206391]|uniref:peptidoglycan-binding protein n=1 Tax=Actinomadura sp. HBU206391 TaxID=2731692 RepID=UPI0016507287|nr:peptidoglycan-binding protein [Actinomadura sp. HBU206391]MBC6461705.1 peptidoglycan-binding protein [Actinomadura sp. HBU206391]
MSGAVALVAVGAVAYASLGTGRADRPATAAPAAATSAPVVRTDVTQSQQVTGALSHAGDFSVTASGGRGVITRLPAIGSVVGRGHTAYEVNGDPVPLLFGERPAWRPFALGMTDGPDVRQLERNLAALGHGAGLTVDRRFSSATYWAVRRWQRARGLPVTGDVPLGQVVFLPGALRVTAHDAKPGTPVRAGAAVEHGTSATRTIEVDLDPAVSPGVRRGDRVRVTMPDGDDAAGRVTDVSRVAVTGDDQGDGAPTEQLIPITISLTRGGRGHLDQAQVRVDITSELHRDVLAVPITALLARPGGGYEVIVVDAGARRRVPVRTGLFDENEGVVEVTAQGLTEGQHVEVPAS